MLGRPDDNAWCSEPRKHPLALLREESWQRRWGMPVRLELERNLYDQMKDRLAVLPLLSFVHLAHLFIT